MIKVNSTLRNPASQPVRIMNSTSVPAYGISLHLPAELIGREKNDDEVPISEIFFSA